jgi:diguanylate cyclase (GGDEF)-like protein
MTRIVKNNLTPAKRFSEQPEVLQHYPLLQSLGVFDQIEELKFQIRDLEELLQEASGIFSQKSIESLMDYIVSCISNKFIPTDLTVILHERNSGAQVFSYKNLRKRDTTIRIESIKPFEDFFLRFPNTIHFNLFEYQFNQPELLQPLIQFNAEIVVPVLGMAGLYGLIIFGPKLLESQYIDEEIGYIDRLMKFTAISIQNIMNYQNAVTDLKTGLYNHSFFMKRMLEEWSNAERYQSDIGLLILDIDHFKQFNDEYGHLAGDEVIITIAERISESVRAGDVVARFGGEEFTVLLLHSDRIRTWNSAERIRQTIENTVITFRGKLLRVTVSIGCATLSYQIPDTMDDFIQNADSALYKAKESGRNRCMMYGESLLFSALMTSTPKNKANL